MDVEFHTKAMTAAVKSVKKMFDRGPFQDEPGCQDCIISTVSHDTMQIEAASNGLYVKADFPADVKQPGRVAISRSTLNSIKLLGERTSFAHKEGAKGLDFQSGQFTGKLAVSTSFDEIEAQIPADIPSLSVALPTIKAQAASKRTCLNATLDVLLRAKLALQDQQMVLSCNDSFRAAAVQNKLENPCDPFEIELPAVFFNTVLQAFECPSLQMGFNERAFRVRGDKYDITHPTLQPTDRPPADVFGKLATLKKEEPIVISELQASALKEAIGAVQSLAPTSEVKLDLFFSERNAGELVVSVQEAASQGKFKIPLQSVKINNRVPVMVNGKYLLELLNLVAADTVSLYAWDRLVVLESEKNGAVAIMPQLKTRDEP